MLVIANYTPYPSGLREIKIPLEDEDKYIRMTIEEIENEVIIDSQNVNTFNEDNEENGDEDTKEPEIVIETQEVMKLYYFDGIDEQEILVTDKKNLTTLIQILRDLARQIQ